MPSPTPPPEDFELSVADSTASQLTAQDLEDALALNLVTATFNQYENFRSMNHDPRWVAQDALYFGYVAPRNWAGTTVPRANLGNSIAFGKVETAVPSIMSSIFFNGGGFFEVQAEDGTSTEEATAWYDVMSYVFEHPNPAKFGTTSMPEFMETTRCMSLYGNGGVSLCWDAKNNCPVIESVDIRDFYIDPATKSGAVDGARGIVRRNMLTVSEVFELLKSDSRMKQFTIDSLQAISTFTPAVVADTTRRMQAAFQAVNFDPAYYNWTPNPADRRIEVLMYYSSKKICFVLNRKYLVFNIQNPYGWIPFCFAPFHPVPGRFYGQSVADTIEGFQRYIEALLNGRLDEISLALHPPRSTSREASLTPGNQKWYPGATISQDPKEGRNSLLQPQATLTNVFTDINFLGMQSDTVSGINSVAQGVPRPGNANRTAGGMEMQMQGNTLRMLPVVLSYEGYLLTPLLYKLYEMIRMHTATDSQLPAMKKDEQGKTSYYKVGGDIITKKCNFRMLASSRMMTQDKLGQMVPYILQNMTNGPFMQGLNAAKLTLDYTELARMIQDATGIEKAYKIVRPLSPEEQQQMNQPPPQVMMEQQQADKDLQTRVQLGQMKAQSAVQVAQIANAPKPPDPFTQQVEQQKAQREQEAKQMELYMNAQANKQKLEFEQRKHQMDMEAKAQELQTKRAQSMIEMQSKREAAASEAQNSQIKQATMVQEAQQKGQIDRELGTQQLSLRQMAADQAAKQKAAAAKVKKTEGSKKEPK